MQAGSPPLKTIWPASFGLWNGQVSSPRNIQNGARLEF
jgi:hypothetical protein